MAASVSKLRARPVDAWGKGLVYQHFFLLTQPSFFFFVIFSRTFVRTFHSLDSIQRETVSDSITALRCRELAAEIKNNARNA
jgi:hypothetical protein